MASFTTACGICADPVLMTALRVKMNQLVQSVSDRRWWWMGTARTSALTCSSMTPTLIHVSTVQITAQAVLVAPNALPVCLSSSR